MLSEFFMVINMIQNETEKQKEKYTVFNIGLNYIFLRDIKIKKNTGAKQENVLTNYKAIYNIILNMELYSENEQYKLYN